MGIAIDKSQLEQLDNSEEFVNKNLAIIIRMIFHAGVERKEIPQIK